MKIPGQQRKAISPIVATVLIIAATLIAFAAVAGYIFGLFGSASSSASIEQINYNMPHSALAFKTFTIGSCVTTSPGTSGAWIEFKNTGTASGSISTFSLNFNGTSIPISYTTGASCAISGSASVYLPVTGTTADTTNGANAGNQFSGTAVTSTGEQVPLSGTLS